MNEHRAVNWARFGLVLYVAAIAAIFVMGDARRGFGTFAVFVGAVVTTVFVFVYGRFCEWKLNPDGSKNHAGRHLMWFARADAVILWYLVGAQWLVFPIEWYQYSRAIVYVTLAALMIWRVWLLVVLRAKARRRLSLHDKKSDAV